MMPGIAGIAGFTGTATPTSDVVFAVQDFDTGTSTGSTSFTSATITGVTPKGALVVGALHQASNDPGETANYSMSLGFVSGSTSRRVHGWTGDNRATTLTAGGNAASSVITVLNSGGTVIKAASGSTTSGGVDLNFTTNTTPSLRHYFVAFAGTDVSSVTSNNNVGTGTSAIDINTVGFQPDAVLFISSGTTNGTSGDLQYSFGIATADGTQFCVMGSEDDAIADGRPFQTLRTDCVAAEVSKTNGSLTYKITASDFDASGFSITPSANAGNDSIIYQALKFTGRQVKLVQFDTPTTTGSHTITGAGFTPQFALVVLTNLEVTDSHPGSTSDNQGGLSVCAIGSDEQWSASWRIDSGAGTTDTASQVANVALMGASATDCDAIKATFSAWTSDGVTLNFSATQGSAKKGFILFVE